MTNKEMMSENNVEYNLLCCEGFDELDDTYERTYFLTSKPNDSDREIWMRDVYDVVVQAKVQKPIYYGEHKANTVAITLPRSFISEVLFFESKERYLNQFKLYHVIGIIENKITYEDERKNSKYPITGKLIEFFSKKKKLIYATLIQESFFRSLDGYVLDLYTFISEIKNMYNNPLDKTNYSFPVSDSEIEDFEKSLDVLDDDNEKEYDNQLRSKTLEFIYKVINPISDVSIDYIYEMELEGYPDTYNNFYEKSGLALWDFSEFFKDALYEKITKQPRMTLFRREYPRCCPDIVLYFSRVPQKTNFKWRDKNIKYEPKRGNIEYIEYFKNKRKINIKSSKYIGEKYEKLCQSWLRGQGYSEVNIVGGRGDKGLDIVAINTRGKKIGVQCKYKKSGTVSSADIRLLNSSREYEKYRDVEELMIFSNSPLTRDAILDMGKFSIVGVTLVGNANLEN